MPSVRIITCATENSGFQTRRLESTGVPQSPKRLWSVPGLVVSWPSSSTESWWMWNGTRLGVKRRALETGVYNWLRWILARGSQWKVWCYFTTQIEWQININLRHLKTNREASFEATPSLEGIGHIDIAAYPQYPSTWVTCMLKSRPLLLCVQCSLSHHHCWSDWFFGSWNAICPVSHRDCSQVSCWCSPSCLAACCAQSHVQYFKLIWRFAEGHNTTCFQACIYAVGLASGYVLAFCHKMLMHHNAS